MRIEHLSLTNFRNYARLEWSPPPGTTLIHGANAQGKTSLLEAICYLALSRSPWSSSDRQLIHWRAQQEAIPFARLAADISSRHSPLERLEITLMLEDAGQATPRFRKVLRLNGADRRVMDLVGRLNAVLFLPRDLALVEGSPADRRQFIDGTLAQVDADYLAALNSLNRLLPQRNALLRRIDERRAAPHELDFWDAQLVEAGAVLIAARQRFLRELEESACRAHHDLTGGRETLTLRYQPSFAPTAGDDGQLSFNMQGLDLHRELDADDIAPQYADRLNEERQLSISRGYTLSGPHRDELRLDINGHDAGLYGSRGQARTAVMALKLAELDWMQARIGEAPLLLLDEVVAELDFERRNWLLERLLGAGQTLLTTTELDIFTAGFLQRASVLGIEAGQIASQAPQTRP